MTPTPNATSLIETNPLREAAPRTRSLDPGALALFGATGGLAHRKRAPALFQVARGRSILSDRAIMVLLAATEAMARSSYQNGPDVIAVE